MGEGSPFHPYTLPISGREDWPEQTRPQRLHEQITHGSYIGGGALQRKVYFPVAPLKKPEGLPLSGALLSNEGVTNPRWLLKLEMWLVCIELWCSVQHTPDSKDFAWKKECKILYLIHNFLYQLCVEIITLWLGWVKKYIIQIKFTHLFLLLFFSFWPRCTACGI